MNQNLLRDYKDEEVIKLIKEKKVEEDLRDLLISSINCNRNKLVKYLLEINVPFDYVDKLQYDAYLMAVSRGNLEAIKLLEQKGLDLFQTYSIDNQNITAVSHIRDLDTLQYFETKKDAKELIKSNLDRIANNTIFHHDLELLKYLVDEYNIDLKNVYYKTPFKNYTILEKAKEILDSMNEKLKRKREMVFFVDELLYGEDNYNRIVKRAYELLNRLEKEVKEIEEYYNYIHLITKNK